MNHEQEGAAARTGANFASNPALAGTQLDQAALPVVDESSQPLEIETIMK